MDFGDIFKVPPPKPSTTSGINIHGVDRKRKADQFAAEDDESHTSVGMLFAKPPPPQEPQFSSEAERIQHLVDRLGEEDGGGPLNQRTVRRIITALDKAIQLNQELRLKYPHEPQKFMESEIELDGEIKRLQQLAAAPEHYGQLVESGIIPSLISLLTHENTDIAIDSIELLQELTDEDVIPENQDDPHVVTLAQQGMQSLINGLVDNQIIELLVSNLERLDEQQQQDSAAEENSRGLFASLGIAENLISSNPALAEQFCSETNLLPWLLDRISGDRPFDSVKQYASEILAILFQESSANRRMLIATDEELRLELLLKSLAVYRKRDPENSDEQEMMENLFDCLCSAICEPPVRKAFIAAEGVELMCLMLKEKLLSRMRALKVLSFTLSYSDGESVATEGAGDDQGCRQACEAFIQNSGLKHLFAALMKKYSKRLRKDYPSAFSDSEENEHSVEILAALFRYFTADPPGFLIYKVLTKLKQDDCDKVDRLLELLDENIPRLKACNAAIEREQQNILDAGEQIENDPALEAEWYLRRMDAGLAIMQNIAQILASLLVTFSKDFPDISKHLLAMMGRKGRTKSELVTILEEYVDNLPKEIAIKTGEKVRVLRLLVGLGGDDSAGEDEKK